MYLKKAHNRKTGRTYLSIARGYRDKERGHTRTKVVEKIGYLDEMQKIHENPIAHFEKVVEEMNRLAEQETAEYTIITNKNKKLKKNTSNRKNYGYIAIMKIFYELGLDRFLINRKQTTNIEFNTSSIMKLLVFSRILSPSSIKKAYENKNRFFEFDNKNTFNLIDCYRALSHFSKLAKDIQLLIHDRITKNYGRKTDFIYYDVTNYYFEIDKEDELKAKGPSKENSKHPIVQMGLAMDEEGLPISYEVFAGNESEKLHLRPTILEIREKYNSGKVIAVADAAQNTGNNIYYLDKGKQGYVFSQSIRGGSEEFKGYVTDENGYVWYGDSYKRKSRVIRRTISVDMIVNGKTVKRDKVIDQRQIVFYSEKYALRAKMKRESTIKKALRIIGNPAAYTSATSYGALKYIKNMETDKKTGELKEKNGIPCLDYEKLLEDEKYDGYYCIVTNLFNDGKNAGVYPDEKIIDIYRGLWRIEDSFRITKSELEARPIRMSRHDRIHAHFLICYISLVIIRLLQKITGYKHSAEKLIEAMNYLSCSNESENLFLFDYRSDVTDDLGKAIGIDFTNERLTRSEIKRNLGNVKK